MQQEDIKLNKWYVCLPVNYTHHLFCRTVKKLKYCFVVEILEENDLSNGSLPNSSTIYALVKFQDIRSFHLSRAYRQSH